LIATLSGQKLYRAQPNGLRYPRWGGDGEAVQPEKGSGVEKGLRLPPNDQAHRRQWSAAELPSGAAPCSAISFVHYKTASHHIVKSLLLLCKCDHDKANRQY
jgi:hypothetical protein